MKAEKLWPPCDCRGERSAVGAAGLLHRVGDVGAHRAEADAEDARDVAVGTAARDQRGNLAFARRQGAVSPAAQQCAPHMRFERVEQIEIARAKVRTALRPPNAKIAEIAVPVEDE